MNEDDIKAALSINIEECGNMTSTWKEAQLKWNDEVISTAEFDHDYGEE